MKNTYLACLLVLLLFPISGAFGQSHLGLDAELLVPIKPYSKGYGVGYGVYFKYRKFEMTRPLIMDVTAGFYHNPGKDIVNVEKSSQGNPRYKSFDNLRTYLARFGLAWAFVPNASPYTQPYAGFDAGIGLQFEDGFISGVAYTAAMRLGWMTYVNERFLFGFEMRYNNMLSSSGRGYDYVTSIGNILEHQLSFQLSTTIKVGR